MKGAHLIAGNGMGGLATTGAGLGGGGTGDGHLYGAGDIDTGGRAARGHGRGPTLSSRKEHEVKLDIAAGNVDEGGGLTKEQVARVVRAHANAIKFCYEKELQRKPTLGGKIEVYWVIVPDGSVEKSKIAVTTMDDTAVEGCIVRQVKQWVFPKSDGRTVVQSYPFLFKGACDDVGAEANRVGAWADDCGLGRMHYERSCVFSGGHGAPGRRDGHRSKGDPATEVSGPHHG